MTLYILGMPEHSNSSPERHTHTHTLGSCKHARRGKKSPELLRISPYRDSGLMCGQDFKERVLVSWEFSSFLFELESNV